MEQRSRNRRPSVSPIILQFYRISSGANIPIDKVG